MIVKFEITRSVTMTQVPGTIVDVLDVCASADEMPFVAALTQNVQSFVASYPGFASPRSVAVQEKEEP